MEEFKEFALSVWELTVGVFLSYNHFLGPVPMIIALLIATSVVATRLARKSGWGSVAPKRILALLFPRRVFLHRSAKHDYAVFIINQIVLFLIGLSAILSPAIVAEVVLGLAGGIGFEPAEATPSVASRILYSIFLMLVWDFSATYAHYLKHRVPVLWEFHKVHHSAEVMTPITALRRHPIDALFGAVIVAMFLGIATAIWTFAFGQSVQPLMIFGAIFGIWIWRALGYNLRHSHIWISYGNLWNQIFISPAQHQVHHSLSPKHHDTNFGHIFAFWDAMFGTLYLPQHEERVKFGIGEADMPKFRTLFGLYVEPFINTWRMLTRSIRRVRTSTK